MRFILFIFIGIFLLSCGHSSNLEKQPIRNSFPSFKLQLIDSSSYIETSTLSKKPILLIVFDTDCGICRTHLKEIIAKNRFFSQTSILLITFSPYKKMKEFYKEYNLASFSNIILARDPEYSSVKFYNLKTVPFTAVYNKQHYLNRTFNGLVDAKVLLNILN